MAERKEENRERRVHHHEFSGAGRASHVDHRTVDVRRNLDRYRGTGLRRHSGPGPIRRQLEPVLQSRQFPAPVAELGCDQRIRVVDVTEAITLPQCVIHILHRQWEPFGRISGNPGTVGAHQVAGEWARREPVAGDVVDDDDENVIVVRHPQQVCAHRGGFGNVETLGRQRIDPDRNLVRGHRLDRHGPLGGTDRKYQLGACAVDFRVDGAQHLVPFHEIADCLLQRADIEVTGQADHQRHVVQRRTRIEPIEDPQPGLSGSQWHRVRPRTDGRRHLEPVAGVRPIHQSGDPADGRRVEEVLDRQWPAESSRDAGGGADRGERIAAEREEVVVDADSITAEHLREHRGHHRFGGSFRSTALGRRRDFRCRQRSAVEFAAGGERMAAHRRHRLGPGVTEEREQGAGEAISARGAPSL